MVKTKDGISEPLPLEDANRQVGRYRMHGIEASILPEEEGMPYYYQYQEFKKF
jgi:hypothetical protein